MPPKKARIHVTFDEETAKFFASLAAQEHKSVANIVKDLALEALAMREDRYLSKMVQEVDKQDRQVYHQVHAQ